MTIAPETPVTPATAVPSFLELELTGRCQLTCGSHCYAEAGPTKSHGSMTGDDWKKVLAEAARLGVEKVQLIGGEPTLHPEFAGILTHALNCQLNVQVFSNLYRVRPRWWRLFGHARVSLGTSYYSDDPAEHDAITGRSGSHAATRAHIIEAIRRHIPVKVGIIHLHDGQRSAEARAEMENLGATHVHVDHVREVGNAATKAARLPSVTQLCGACGDSRAAIGPDGQVWPCVLSRFLHPAGNVRECRLAEVFATDTWAALVSAIPRRGTVTLCKPGLDGGDCSPAETPACAPAY